MELALKRGDGEDEWEVVPWEKLESASAGWWIATVTTPMNNWWHGKDNRHHAQLRVENLLQQQNVLAVREMRVKLEGRLVGLSEWFGVFR